MSSESAIKQDWENIIGKDVPVPDFNKLSYIDLLAICSMISWAYRNPAKDIAHGSGKDSVCAVLFYTRDYSMVLYKTKDGGFGFTDDTNHNNLNICPDLRNYVNMNPTKKRKDVNELANNLLSGEFTV